MRFYRHYHAIGAGINIKSDMPKPQEASPYHTTPYQNFIFLKTSKNATNVIG
jgi:hypothetical protein